MQFGFRKGKTTYQATLAVVSTMDLAALARTHIATVDTDCKSAFDCCIPELQGDDLLLVADTYQISLITPKIAVPKAVAYFNTPPIDLPKTGQSNSIYFVGYKLLLHCDDLLLMQQTRGMYMTHTITEW